jgi:hypothetical protein
MKLRTTPAAFILSALAVACFGSEPPEGPDRLDDTDEEADADADADADSDTDTDSDTAASPYLHATIPEIQLGTIEPGTLVEIAQVQVVGAQLQDGFHVADPASLDAFGGLWIVWPRDDAELVGEGALIRVTGEVAELSSTPEPELGDGSLTALRLDQPFVLVSEGEAPEARPVASETLLDPERAEPYEGMLLRIEQATVSAGGEGAWQVDGGLAICTKYHSTSVLTGASFEAIQGLLWYDQGSFSLCPRGEEDLAGYDPLLDDCGEAACIDIVAEGELVLTEIMADPEAVVDDLGEWFELSNLRDEPVDLRGLVVSDALGAGFTVTESVIVQPGAYAVLAANGDPARNGGVDAAWDYPYASLSLANGVDEISLSHSDVIFDRVAWDDGVTFPRLAGASMALDPDQLDAGSNDDGGNWCTATSAYGDGDLGTPGAANAPCHE